MLLVSCALLFVFAMCNEYPHGASVAIQIRGASLKYKPVAEFESWLTERMKTFSEAKKDFTFTGGFVNDSNAVVAGVTHIFIISIDSMNLVPFNKYKVAVDSANLTAAKVSPIGYLIGGSYGQNVGQMLTRISYDVNAHPSMSVYLAIKDIKTGKNTWDYSKQIDIESNAALPEEEQVGQLFAVLKGVVSDEAGFLSIKK